LAKALLGILTYLSDRTNSWENKQTMIIFIQTRQAVELF